MKFRKMMLLAMTLTLVGCGASTESSTGTSESESAAMSSTVTDAKEDTGSAESLKETDSEGEVTESEEKDSDDFDPRIEERDMNLEDRVDPVTIEDLEQIKYNYFDYSILQEAPNVAAPEHYFAEEIKEPSDVFNYMFDAYGEDFDFTIGVLDTDEENGGTLVRNILVESSDFFYETDYNTVEVHGDIQPWSKGIVNEGDIYQMD